MRHQQNILKNEQGFTLIEIIAVLIILGILSAVAVPKYINLQEDARMKSAQAAIAEVKSRLSMGYGQYLLKNDGTPPADVKAICNNKGINDKDIMPRSGSGNVPVGDDYKVSIAANDTGATITVSEVQGVDLDNDETGEWVMP